VELHIKLKEKSRFLAKTSTELGSNEGSANISATCRSVFGGAETLTANLAFGTRTRRAFNLSLSAPLVRLDPLANTWGDVSIFSRENDWTASSSCFLFEEGLVARLTRKGIRWQNELKAESVLRSIDHLTPNASMSIRQQAGSTLKNSVGWTATFDNRTDPQPSTGVYIKSAQELAATYSATFFKSILESQVRKDLLPGLTLSWGCRAGFLYPFGTASHVPLPDRLFLGGASDVRLFRERGMGPHDEGDALGGELMWASGVSLIGDIPRKAHWPVKWHAFVNAGRLDHYNKDRPLATQVQNALQTPSVSAGLGLIYKFDWMRVELNFGMPLAQSRGEKTRKGFQLGVGVEYL